VNLAAIPEELRSRPQWVGWVYAFRNPRWTKIPINVRTGGYAASDTPATWSTFEQVVAAYGKPRVRRLDGIGYVFAVDCPYAGIDLDGCIDPTTGVIADWAVAILTTFRGAYAEVSPSGEGIKLFVRGSLPGAGRSRGGFGPDGRGKIEIYDRLRFFTLTGRALEGFHRD
jgi:primase-polymerase (primpol)-like protein